MILPCSCSVTLVAFGLEVLRYIAEYAAAALCGAGLGATELLSRYRDAPFDTLKIRYARNYLVINALLAMVSLFLVQTIASGIVPDVQGVERPIYEVLIAGFGGAILFRSAIVRSRIGDADVGVGPSFVIETLLAATDRQVDRQRAIDRADTVPPLMSDLNVVIVTTVLVPYTLSLLQNLSAQERQDIETKVDSLVTKRVDEDVKPLIFGLMLINLVGADGLQKAKQPLASVIKKKKKAQRKVPAAETIEKVIEEQRAAGAKSEAELGQSPDVGAAGDQAGTPPQSASAPSGEKAPSAVGPEAPKAETHPEDSSLQPLSRKQPPARKKSPS